MRVLSGTTRPTPHSSQWMLPSSIPKCWRAVTFPWACTHGHKPLCCAPVEHLLWYPITTDDGMHIPTGKDRSMCATAWKTDKIRRAVYLCFLAWVDGQTAVFEAGISVNPWLKGKAARMCLTSVFCLFVCVQFFKPCLTTTPKQT